jgi:RimJ/RimL family protein N-acetyltransferase
MRIDTVQRRDWREYREIRLAALKDAPSAFASTWQEEASLTASQWIERAQLSEDGDTLTIVIAADEAGRWVGLAGGFRPGERGADAELISMWVTPGCRGRSIGRELIRAVLAWARSHRASSVGLWVNAANRPAISLYAKAGFLRTGEVDKLPSDPTQQEIRMLHRIRQEDASDSAAG